MDAEGILYVQCLPVTVLVWVLPLMPTSSLGRWYLDGQGHWSVADQIKDMVASYFDFWIKENVKVALAGAKVGPPKASLDIPARAPPCFLA